MPHDPSSLRSPERFSRNLDLLSKKQQNAEVFIRSVEVRVDSTAIEVLQGREGFPTAKVQGRYIHSKLAPRREARRIIENVLEGGTDLAVFLGFGLGYHVEEFLSRYPEKSALVIEKSASLLRAAIGVRDYEELFSEGKLGDRLNFLFAPSPEEVRKTLAPFSRRKITPVVLEQFTLPAPEYYEEIKQTIENITSRRKVNLATLRRFGKLWVRNLTKNLSLLVEAEDAGELENCASGIPALLLAGGPSLDTALSRIDELRKKAVIIAVDTAAGALAERGYAPDILVVVDPQYWNTRHLDPAFRRPGLLESTLLVSESSTHPRIFRLPVARLFFGGSVFPLGEYFESAVVPKRKLGAGGSVATTAWDVAGLIGSSVIYTAGLDLGFPGGKTHYSGGFFEKRMRSFADRFSPYTSDTFAYLMGGDPSLYPNNIGGMTLTDKRLAVYRRWFEEQLQRPDAPKTVNTCGEAIRIEGIEYGSFEELLSMDDRREELDRVFAEWRKKGLDKDMKERNEVRRKALEARIEELSSDLERLLSLSEKALHLASLLRKTPHSSESEIFYAQLDHIDEEIRKSVGKEVAGFLIQPILEEITGESERSGTVEEAIDQSIRLYDELYRSVRYHLDLLQMAFE